MNYDALGGVDVNYFLTGGPDNVQNPTAPGGSIWRDIGTLIGGAARAITGGSSGGASGGVVVTAGGTIPASGQGQSSNMLWILILILIVFMVSKRG